MSATTTKESPSAAVKVRLLQDAIYAEDGELWTALLRHRGHIETYFGEIGLDLVVHEEDGFAYLKQGDPDDDVKLPRLFRRDRLTKGIAIIGVVLREQLLHFEEALHDTTRLVLRRAELMRLIEPYFPESNDQLREEKRLDNLLTKAQEFGLLRKLESTEEDSFEVRRIVKARFPIDLLQQLRDALLSHVSSDER
jgi:hypothetical protein